MAPYQAPVLRQPHPSIIIQKMLISYKLFLLESAQHMLEQEVLHFTNKVYEDICSVSSSFTTSLFSDITQTLDTKCQEMVKLSASFKEVKVEPDLPVQPAVTTNYFQPLMDKGSLMTRVLKYGPMLQNSLMAIPVTKMVQVLGAGLPCRQLKLPLNFQPVIMEQDDKSVRTLSSSNNTTLITSSSRQSKPKEGSIFEAKIQPASVYVPPATTQSGQINKEKSDILLPPIQSVFPEINNRKPPVIWAHVDDIQVQHQKQTSSQLLQFLRARAQNMGALEVSVLEWTESKGEANNSASPQLVSPSVKTQSHRFRHVVTDELLKEQYPETLHANAETQAPVFRVERVESSGSLIYRCVIATETELWDIGNVFTEVSQENKLCPSETLMQKSVNIPEFQIRKFEETEVVVSHIVSPGNFYIQYTDSLEKLQALHTDCKAICSYDEQNFIPDIGTRVMGWFPQDERWCRAEVMKICGVSRGDRAVNGAVSESSIKMEVKRLDYGDTSCLSLRNMKELTPEMSLLPLQALQVSLANVTPINKRDWSEEAVGWFKAMVHNRTLYARVYPQGATVTAELFLEKGKLGAMRRGAPLSLRLAQNGHAKHQNLKNFGLIKRRAVQDSDWEKYLISRYTQVKK